ncbi:MAG TPA: cupin domain-containing protein [Baekduia sp.]|uniref:cupin domain-containing protein n=1 Tax=Baekduia sp. TaxID=2600305 RepID=UPI002D774DA4|nr:cupin domain-containing protein [Baekduia sp.]HET6506447.1 cupin domain-containing protein [Baekduia sp.]
MTSPLLAGPAAADRPLETIVFPSGRLHEVVAADDDHLVIQLTVAPMERPNTPHVHDTSDEVFEVLGGHVLFTLAGVAHHLAAGDSIVIPHGAVHFWQVVGDRDLTARVTLTPGCRLHLLLRDLAALEVAGRVKDGEKPGLRDFALLQRRHRHDVRFATMPRPVLRMVVCAGLALAAVTGRRLL